MFLYFVIPLLQCRYLYHACDYYRKPRSWRRSLWTVPPAVRPELLTRDACYIRLARREGEGRTDRRRKEDGKEKDEGDENLASNSRDQDSTRTNEKFTLTITRPLHFSQRRETFLSVAYIRCRSRPVPATTCLWRLIKVRPRARSLHFRLDTVFSAVSSLFLSVSVVSLEFFGKLKFPRASPPGGGKFISSYAYVYCVVAIS